MEAVDVLPDRLPSSGCPAGMGATNSKHVDMIKIILLLASLLPCHGKTIRPVKLDKLFLLRYLVSRPEYARHDNDLFRPELFGKQIFVSILK